MKIARRLLQRYGLPLVLLLVIANIGLLYVTNIRSKANTCFTTAQLSTDARCLYVLNGKVYNKGSRAAPHQNHPCGMDVTSIIPSFHTATPLQYLDPNYVGDICPAPSITPSPTLVPPSPTATPASATPSPTPDPTCPKKNQGDADCDGQIKLADYDRWRREFYGEITSKTADFSADGRVTLVDHSIWRQTFFDLNGGTGPSATPVPTTPANNPSPTTPPATAGCVRPYTADSPWNTKLINPTYHAQSATLISTLNGKTLTSDPTQYSYPVYFVTAATPIRQVKINGTYSKAENGGTTFTNTNNTTVSMPIPDTAQSSPGTDAQIILINESTGDQWTMWQGVKNGTSWTATNGSYYNNNWSAVAPVGYGARGGGIPYYAGLIRKCEITQGHIDHAIAFAYDYPCSQSTCAAQGFPYFVRPAAKSDGQGTNAHDFPEGTRLQLVATDAEIATMCGSDSTCVIIAKALRDYGMITLDNSGRPKVYAESSLTANWGNLLTANTVSPIPLSKFKVIAF